MEYIKQKDPLCVLGGARGVRHWICRLVSRRIVAAKAAEVPLFSKQKVQKAKETAPMKSKGEGKKKKAPSQAKVKRKIMKSPTRMLRRNSC